MVEDSLLFYGFGETKFGKAIIAFNENKEIVYLSFMDITEEEALRDLRYLYMEDFIIRPKQDVAEKLLHKAFTKQPPKCAPVGTDFEKLVWKVLRRIPYGALVSYGYVAKKIGKPRAIRAVATAIASNKIGFLIPCHRVVNKSGSTGGYRWGVQRKRDMIEFENGGVYPKDNVICL